MKKYLLSLSFTCVLGLSIFSFSASAADNQTEQNNAMQAAEKAAIAGPSSVTIAGQTQLTIPKGYNFIPKTQAIALMDSVGNGQNPSLEGLLTPTQDTEAPGFYTIEYAKDGYVKDDDAKDLNPDEILTQYKEGTEAANKDRVAKGFPAIEVAGWAQKPVYDAAQHRLTWALIAHDKGTPAGPNDSINYETRILGRDGVLSMTWIAGVDQLATGKTHADQITAGVAYVDGKKYSDYSASAGDKIAEYGLATLITGVVAKKLGLLAVIGVFLAKFAKIGIFALFGLFPFLKRIFKKTAAKAETQNNTVDEQQTASTTAPPASLNKDAASQQELTDTTKL